MTEQEALDAFFDEWHKQANEAGESLTQPQRDCAEEAWYAGIDWLRSQGEPVGVVRNCSANGLRVSIMDAGLYAGQYLYAAPQPAIPDGWQPIETAPMDGTVFLGYRNGKVREAFRVQRDDCEMWCFGSVSGAVEFFPSVRPTHWMHMPDEPEQK